MNSKRRNFIRIMGTSAVILAAAGSGFALTREPSSALQPWRKAGNDYKDPRLRALSYAILAPNPHNRQPWQVQLVGADELLLYCDPERLLPETDPFGRQIVIGLGCFLELLQLAAQADGFNLTITPFPQGEFAPATMPDQRPVARVKFVAAKALTDPLFAQVLKRRSNKEPYALDRQVSDAKLATLHSVSVEGAEVAVTNAKEQVATLRDLTWAAHQIEVLTPRTYMESVNLMRIGKAEIEASPDGIDIGGAFPEALKLLGVLTRETIADVNSSAFEQGMAMYHEIMHSAMGYVWVTTPGNSRIDQLNAGRAWVRINLQATAQGLDTHPVSQALQEYSEMTELYQQLHQQLGVTEPQRLQMLARLGYGPTVPESPRWPVAKRLLAT